MAPHDTPPAVPPVMKRLFVAIDLPPAIKANLAEAQAELKRHLPGIHAWTPMNQMHVTVKFLGPTPIERQGAVEACLAEVARAVAPFRMRLQGIGAFPNARAHKVLWAGVVGDRASLFALQERMEKDCVGLGFMAAEGTYQPHATLGRRRGQERQRSSERFLARFADRDFGEFLVPSVVLVRSDLHVSGAVHVVEREFALGGGHSTSTEESTRDSSPSP